MSILEHFVQLRPSRKPEMLITDKKVGDILIEQNLINANQLKHALYYQKSHPEYNGKVGEICVQLGWIKKIDLIKVVSEHYHIPLAIAILEKRELARKMQRESSEFVFDEGKTKERLEEKNKHLAASIIDNDFIDSLTTLNEENIEPSEFFSDELDYRDNSKDFSSLKAIKNETKPIKSQKYILDLVLTKKLQNGLISTKDTREKQSADYILKLIRSSEIKSALTYIEKIKNKYTHSALFCQIHVFALIHDYRFEQAEKCLNEFNPDYELYPQLLDLKSIIHQLLDQHELAVKNFTDIIQTKKLSEFCYFSLAYSLDQLNLSKQAGKIYKHFTTLAKSNLNKQRVYAQGRI